MSKVMQEHYLVVYQRQIDFIEKLEHLVSQALDGKCVYKMKDSELIVKTKYGTQECYYFKCFHGDVQSFWMGIANCEFVAPIFLDGDYPSKLVNYMLTRCRNGTCMVDEI